MATSFTKFFSVDETEQLKIPTDFAQTHYGNLRSTTSVSVVFTTEMFWTVTIKKINESLYITKGWSQIVRDIPLKQNHFLEFVYEKPSVIFLHVYTADRSNILSVLNAVKSETETDYSIEEADLEQTEDPPTFNATVVVRKPFRLPTKLAKLAGFYDGMKIKIAYEQHRIKTFKLQAQSNMVTYTRFTMKNWGNFASRCGITVGQRINLTHDFQTHTLTINREV